MNPSTRGTQALPVIQLPLPASDTGRRMGTLPPYGQALAGTEGYSAVPMRAAFVPEFASLGCIQTARGMLNGLIRRTPCIEFKPGELASDTAFSSTLVFKQGLVPPAHQEVK